MTTNTSVHACSYYCERPGYIRAQRDELRDRMEAVLAQRPAAVDEEMVERAAEAAWPEFKSGLEERIWLRAPVVRKDRLRIIVRTALTAALAAQPGGDA